MGTEIERKFLLTNNSWRKGIVPELYRQAYLSIDKSRTVRLRTVDETAWLTVKGKNDGPVRSEYEYEIPKHDANEMIDRLCLKPAIEKNRYIIPFAGLIWEVDEFLGVNLGLVVAEVELLNRDQKVSMPDWVGEEVTGIEKYYNSKLIENPFTSW